MYRFRCNNCHGTGRVPNTEQKEFERRIFEIMNAEIPPIEKCDASKACDTEYSERGMEECPVCLGVGMTKVGNALLAMFVTISVLAAFFDGLIGCFWQCQKYIDGGGLWHVIFGFSMIIMAAIISFWMDNKIKGNLESFLNQMEEK